MKAKYLGRFEVSYELTDEIKEECDYCETVLYHEDDDSNWYDLGQFMRIADSKFDGIAGESNTSAIALKLDDCGEYARLWRIW